ERKTQPLLQALLVFRLHVRGFSNTDLREALAQLLGKAPGGISSGQMTYLLRKLKPHSLISHIMKSGRYQLTKEGLRPSLFYTCSYARLLQPAAAYCLSDQAQINAKRNGNLTQLAAAMSACCRESHLAG
ncbi:MAG TPA: hypothetical protein VGS41_11420, partial [Chthonomonadales bacterium]|nr:hypothetical protein [Chthonomonadales bacterium]